ncbi:maleylpyruvate isomerase family mycothiol-dependent enzyme [Geodermatophilus sp. CPCC 206100]|uniref:maleylpyruvate isomerase family mycothiol-dependent enzyme n=1 Tax=Geodermatophilus sp. CPCC 206100 TaxID=3020054 RepID=UPI003B0051E7
MTTTQTDLWALVHAERGALAADLAGLDEDRWATPSLCSGLTVREVLAHLTAAASLNGLRWLAGVVRCRFDFDRQVAMRLAEHLGTSGADTLARFRRVVGSTTAPPLPRIALLGEVVVHGADIRRPLGLTRDLPPDTVTRVAEYYSRTDQVVVAKGRIGGLRLAATDGPFSTGAGALVSGPTLALVMAMTGRAAFLEELTGDGVEVLRTRC